MRIRKSFGLVIIAVFAVGIIATTPLAHAQKSAPSCKTIAPAMKSDTVPVTTSSKEAREDYELGLSHREDLLFTEEGIDFFRKSVKADPHFALGHATLAFFTTDPVEEVRELALAKASVSRAAAR